MTRKIAFFEGWSWFKFNNLGLVLGRNLKFCTSMAKELKLKVRKLWGPNSTFVEVTGEKLIGRCLFVLPSWIGLINFLIEARKKGWISWFICETWQIHSYRTQIDTNGSYFSFTFNETISVSCVLWNLCNKETKLHLIPNF